MTAQTCPHCRAPVRGGGRPSCLCAAVGADDFDPLRIRPYVSLPDGDVGDGEADDGGDNHGGAGDPGSGTGRGDLLELPGVDAAVHRADGPSDATGPPLAPAPPATGPAEPLAPRMRRRPSPASRTFQASEEERPTEEPPGRSPASLRHKRLLPAVLLTAGAAVAATAALIGTDALSDDTRTRATAPGHGTASPGAALPTGGASAPAPSGAASPTATRSPSPDATAPEATVRPYRTPAPSTPAPTRASGSVSDSPATHGPSAPPTGPLVLREGAGGPEVRELQGRLRQVAVYPGPDDGRYDADVRDAVSRYQRAYGVAGDPDGVYGAVTRASLESRTHEP
ncbi:peptidoglycan-binding domain-containing protein [Streptomyces sp. Isolate_219]|uniref:peptidoglycan-binding domain-containing protein n=1 Tax=Streptomyces sp. Isolate_219 TaxID=2950110 RepID=UPI0021C8AEA6|nr:peptidoglycan-binding protein [Streptomyces sp. Isolate_219]MCR8578353.1 peptidoglycan-binding protein [Streptomyces sp. Isolate_219]